MLFINNDQVADLLSMKDCIRVQEEAFKAQETGGAIHRPRIDMYTPCERDDGYYLGQYPAGSESARRPRRAHHLGLF